MKFNKCKTGFFLVLIFWGLAQLGCQSDHTADQSAGNSADVVTTKASDPGEVEKARILEVQKLISAHDDFRLKFKVLQEEYNLIPGEVKRNARNSDDLEARLEGYLEKGGTRVDELKQVLSYLNAGRVSGGSDKGSTEPVPVFPGGDAQMQAIIEEDSGAVAELSTEYEILKKALAQLKAAIPNQGKGVVLFE